jgi:hypothetical protein
MLSLLAGPAAIASCPSTVDTTNGGPPASPTEICTLFIKMIVRERPSEAPQLGAESIALKRKQCVEYNTRRQAANPQEYAHMARCTVQQPWAVNWAVCGFRIEADDPNIGNQPFFGR